MNHGIRLGFPGRWLHNEWAETLNGGFASFGRGGVSVVAKCARSQETRPLEPDPCADAEINSQPPDSRTWHGSAKGRRRWHFLYVQLYVTVIQDYVALALFF